MTPTSILEAARTATPMMRVRTTRDALPTGLAVAMAPALVNWNSSRLARDDGYYVVNNVNIGSNPVAGETILGTVRIPTNGVERVEFVLVTSRVASVETDAGHALLRFVFHEAARPIVLNPDGDPLIQNAELDDLVISWEAWRSPTAGFDPIAGLDPQSFALTMRCLNGPVRCLNDAMADRPWTRYPITLPGVPGAAADVMYMTLLLGDAVARHTILALVNQRISEATGSPHGYEAFDPEALKEIRDLITQQAIPEDPIGEIMGGEVSYHILRRSCVTMALTCIDTAVARACQRADISGPGRIRVAPESVPPFFERLANGHRRDALLRLPGMLHWLARNTTVVPGRAYELLDEVGLLQRDAKGVVRYYTDNRSVTPYGRLSDHLIV